MTKIIAFGVLANMAVIVVVALSYIRNDFGVAPRIVTILLSGFAAISGTTLLSTASKGVDVSDHDAVVRPSEPSREPPQDLGLKDRKELRKNLRDLRTVVQIFARTAPWRKRLPSGISAWINEDLGKAVQCYGVK